ncbi:MAG: hypothetical protein IJV27_01640 [Prevotella sp.]|nr:hypothetical protein [Prevotella sp.]
MEKYVKPTVKMLSMSEEHLMTVSGELNINGGKTIYDGSNILSKESWEDDDKQETSGKPSIWDD